MLLELLFFTHKTAEKAYNSCKDAFDWLRKVNKRKNVTNGNVCSIVRKQTTQAFTAISKNTAKPQLSGTMHKILGQTPFFDLNKKTNTPLNSGKCFQD